MSSEKPAVANSKGAPRPHYRQQRKKAPSKKDTVEKPSACIEPPALAVIQNDAPIKTVPGREPIHDEIIKKKRINHKRNAAKITTPSTTAPTPTPEAAARHPPQKQPEQKPQPQDSPREFVPNPAVEELARAKKILAFQALELEQYRQDAKVQAEVLEQIRHSLQCPICLDLMKKPHVIVPCGHVCCQGCLVKWFYPSLPKTSAQVRKTCPSCRAEVFERPAPLFLARDLIHIIDKAVAGNGNDASASGSGSWDRLFPKKEQKRVADDEELWEPYPGFLLHSSGGGPSTQAGICRSCGIAYGTGRCTCRRLPESEVSNYSDEGALNATPGRTRGQTNYEHVYPRWAPPLFSVDPSEVDQLDNIQLLRRGATPAMVQRYAMTYNHDEGICATIENQYGTVGQIYLGWNINIEPNDHDGRLFVDGMLQEMRTNPELFAIENCDEGPWLAWMLVPRDQAVEFDLTDSEVCELDWGW